MAWRLLRHAILVVVDNLEAALRIGLLLTLFGQVAVAAANYATTGQFAPSEEVMLAAGGGWLRVAAGLLSIAVGIVVAITWHRFVLLNELPDGWIPRFPSQFWSYVLALLLLSIVMAVVMGVPVGIIVAALGVGSFEGLAALVFFLIFAVALVAVPAIYLRLGIILPARALNKKITMGEAWDKTRPLAWSLIVLVLLGGLLLFAVLAVLGLAVWLGVAAILFNAILGFVMTMISASLLTTVYGVAIEGRDLR